MNEINANKKRQIAALAREGYSTREIAKRTNVAKATVARQLEENNYKSKRIEIWNEAIETAAKLALFNNNNINAEQIRKLKK